jgi:hypothetical protein
MLCVNSRARAPSSDRICNGLCLYVYALYLRFVCVCGGVHMDVWICVCVCVNRTWNVLGTYSTVSLLFSLFKNNFILSVWAGADSPFSTRMRTNSAGRMRANSPQAPRTQMLTKEDLLTVYCFAVVWTYTRPHIKPYLWPFMQPYLCGFMKHAACMRLHISFLWQDFFARGQAAFELNPKT